MEELRRHLVVAMKYGKQLHIKLRNCAVDFNNIWNDSCASTRLRNTKFDCYGDVTTSLKGSWIRSLESAACKKSTHSKSEMIVDGTKTKNIFTTSTSSTMPEVEFENAHGI